MTIKFNPKHYKGKARIYTAVPRYARISRLWVWNEEQQEYLVPQNGGIYYAARYGSDASGNRKRTYATFATLEEARQWQEGADKVSAIEAMMESAGGPLFREVLDEWRRRRFTQLAEGTKIQYEKIIRLHFGRLFHIPVRDITPKQVDIWLDGLREGVSKSPTAKTRRSFDHELSLLSTVLKYYLDYHDDTEFRFPIKRRHREAMYVVHGPRKVAKDISEEEFFRFRDELQRLKNGRVLAALATVQYYQALRISEAAGLFWEDVHLEWARPQNSRLKIVRSVCYPHKTGAQPYVKDGFKNSGANEGMKEQPVFPESFHSLVDGYTEGKKGMVFSLNGEPIAFSLIAGSYNRAFIKSGLPYRGTHVLRHGGCRRVYNEAGELPVAQQLLGNSDMKTTLIYAKRKASALTDVAHRHWEKSLEGKKPARLLASACTDENRK